MSGIVISTDPTTELHPNYGPCDGFGPGGQCAECARPRFATERDWELWLRSDARALVPRLERVMGELAEITEIIRRHHD